MLYLIIITSLFKIINIECIGREQHLETAQIKSDPSSNKTAQSLVQSNNINIPAVLKVPGDPFSGTQEKVEDNKIDVNPVQGVANKEKVLNTQTNNQEANKLDNNVHSGNVETKDKNSTKLPIPPNVKEDIEPGALLRGFYVFLGLGALVMVYFVFRSYRLRHGSQPSTTVRKYGIIARRSDMEMRPLELEEEDDDTLFEINNHNNTNR